MSAKRIQTFKCPYCEKRFTRDKLSDHIEDKHEDMIPEGFTPLRLTYNYVNRRPLSYHGRCAICKKDTPWDENKGRYDHLCGSKQCHDEYIKRFENNMKKKTGHTRISDTAEGQEKMLANRKISGTYKFKDGGEKTYTGKYELHCLEFLDKVMNIKSEDIMAPGPVLKYTHKTDGKLHIYLPDFYYIPYNLIIEVKDGGTNPNKRNMPDYRLKQIEKEEYIIHNTNYNYIRLTNDNLSQLMAIFCDLKMQLVENSGERVIRINEMMNALMTGAMPGIDSKGGAYIVNYMQNNVFSGDEEPRVGVTNSQSLTNIVGLDFNNRMATIDRKDIKNPILHRIDYTNEQVSKILSKYMGTVVPSKYFIYEVLNNGAAYNEALLDIELERVYTTEEYVSAITNYIFENAEITDTIDTIVAKVDKLGLDIKNEMNL